MMPRHSLFLKGTLSSIDDRKEECSDVQSSSWCGQLKQLCDCTCKGGHTNITTTAGPPGDFKTLIFRSKYDV